MSETIPSSSSRDTPLVGQIALVTGATRGIGKATARLLASLGASVALHYNSDEAGANAMQHELTNTFSVKFSSKFDGWKADMGNYDDVRPLSPIAQVIAPSIMSNFRVGGHQTDILPIIAVNLGSTSGLSGVSSASDVDMAAFEKTWRVNCGSAYLLTQLCLPTMEKAGWGRVVFVSSVAGITGGIIGPHYASAKSALHGLVHWLANAYAKKGVTVNAVAPALIEYTKMLPGSSEELSKKIPIGRLGEPEEIAETILWMVKTGYVSNKVVAVDGGMVPL